VAEDIALIEESMPRRMPGTHHERLARQERGDAVCLVAWLDGVPVGHLLLKWAGSQRFASVLPTCPTLSDIAVHPEYQSRGMGSQLMDAAERLAAQRGYCQVGLGVALENVRARALYEGRGYRDCSLGSYCSRWLYLDARGQEQWREETCVRLVKPLTKQTP
jgi:ribosomal protein S18 acetylase RimI-like enzyme